jgi:hypothetical protein
LITGFEVRRQELMLARNTDALFLGIELCSSLLLREGAFACIPLLFLGIRACCRASLHVLLISLELLGAHLRE